MDDTKQSFDETAQLKMRLKNSQLVDSDMTMLEDVADHSTKPCSTQKNKHYNISDIYDPYSDNQLSITTSFLRPNSSFIGSQQSGRSVYDVQVSLKEVNLRESFLTGFLTIHNITEKYPVMTTFFKAEIIGTKYSFYTMHSKWGSSKRNDIQHWDRFPSWRGLNFNMDNDSANAEIYEKASQNEFIYMRWKELFLVPDASITNIKGASFAGFYYICFNQLTGSINGLYFYKSSDRFQQLELSHVPDGGMTPSYRYA